MPSWGLEARGTPEEDQRERQAQLKEILQIRTFDEIQAQMAQRTSFFQLS